MLDPASDAVYVPIPPLSVTDAICTPLFWIATVPVGAVVLPLGAATAIARSYFWVAELATTASGALVSVTVGVAVVTVAAKLVGWLQAKLPLPVQFACSVSLPGEVAGTLTTVLAVFVELLASVAVYVVGVAEANAVTVIAPVGTPTPLAEVAVTVTGMELPTRVVGAVALSITFSGVTVLVTMLLVPAANVLSPL